MSEFNSVLWKKKDRFVSATFKAVEVLECASISRSKNYQNSENSDL